LTWFLLGFGYGCHVSVACELYSDDRGSDEPIKLVADRLNIRSLRVIIGPDE